ncbi:MAG: VWA domain-containing protein [Candidatus Acidiferrales bacterium]
MSYSVSSSRVRVGPRGVPSWAVRRIRVAVSDREAVLANSLNGETRGRTSRRLPAAGAALFVAVLAACSLAPLAAQAPSTTPPPPPQGEPPAVIRVQTNVVLVRVVVRDGHGNAVTGLVQADFQVFDNDKPQTIAYFSAENAAGQPAAAGTPATGQTGPPPTNPPSPESGQRYTALFFDDYHLQFEDLYRARNAAQGSLTKALNTGDRIGVFTASAQVTLDFTTDADKLQKALSQLRIQASPAGAECPPCHLTLRNRSWMTTLTRRSSMPKGA